MSAAAPVGPAEVTLVPWSLPAARRLVDGLRLTAADTSGWHPDYPTADTVSALALVLGAYEVDGPLTAAPSWWVNQIRFEDHVVGDAGWHGPPEDAGPVEVELGYAVVPPLRGRGIATRACTLLLDQAWRAGATRVRAETTDDNAASCVVLRRCGFVAGADGVHLVGRPA